MYLSHLRDPRTLCIVFCFEISNLPPRCVAHRKEEKQPYSGESSVYGCCFSFFSVGYTHTLKSHHCMVVVVFLLFCGLHNEAGDSKFRKGRQYIAYVGHGGVETRKVYLIISSVHFCLHHCWNSNYDGIDGMLMAPLDCLMIKRRM